MDVPAAGIGTGTDPACARQAACRNKTVRIRQKAPGVDPTGRLWSGFRPQTRRAGGGTGDGVREPCLGNGDGCGEGREDHVRRTRRHRLSLALRQCRRLSVPGRRKTTTRIGARAAPSGLFENSLDITMSVRDPDLAAPGPAAPVRDLQPQCPYRA